MAYITIDTTVQVDLDDIDTDTLVEELQRRDVKLAHIMEDHTEQVDQLKAIYHRRRLGLDYQKELDDLLYSILGVIV
jgi:hypothetical protein